MTLVEQLQKDTLAARKERTDAIKVTLLVTLLGEVTRVGKDDGNRITTDDEANTVITKFVKNLKEVTKYGNAEQKAVAERELKILQGYLPKQLTNDQLARIMTEQIVATGDGALGPIMKFLKTNYTGSYDGAQAKAVFESLVTLNA